MIGLQVSLTGGGKMLLNWAYGRSDSGAAHWPFYLARGGNCRRSGLDAFARSQFPDLSGGAGSVLRHGAEPWRVLRSHYWPEQFSSALVFSGAA